MADEEKTPCDPEDLMCQFRILGHLQGLERELGTESFKVQFPQFTGIGETVAERVESQKATLRGSFERCGIPVPDDLRGYPTEVTAPEESIEPEEEA